MIYDLRLLLPFTDIVENLKFKNVFIEKFEK